MTTTSVTVVAPKDYPWGRHPGDAYMSAEGYRYVLFSPDAFPGTPGPLSDYFDGRDWQFRSLAAAKRACGRANLEAAQRGDGLRFAVLDRDAK